MASLQRAVLTLQKLNLHGISRDIRDALRQLQDAYSEELDLNGLDASSQGSIGLGEPEENDYKEGSGEAYEYERGESRSKSQQGEAEQRSASGNTKQGDEEHEVNKEEGRKSALEGKDYLEAANLEVAFSHPSLRYHDIDSVLKSGNSSSHSGAGDPTQRATMQRSSFSG